MDLLKFFQFIRWVRGLRLHRIIHISLLLSIIIMFSCRTGFGDKSGDPESETELLREKLVELQLLGKALQQEIILAKKPEPYLLLNLHTLQVEFKAKGRVLRTFTIKRVKAGVDSVPDTAKIITDIMPIQKTERPKIQPGEGQNAVAEMAQKNSWGPDRMPRDYDLFCSDGTILEIRALTPERSVFAPIGILKNQYAKILAWYRHKSSTERDLSRAIQLWMGENDSRLLFWSLPDRLHILIIQPIQPLKAEDD